MIMPVGLRRVVFTAHVATSVGWMGAVAAYLALDLTATTSRDVQTVRASYRAMELIAWNVIVPLALATVVIGIGNALGTRWGLVRHYWVIVKLLLTAFATTVLLVEVRVVSALADAAGRAADPRDLPGTLVHSVGGLIVLLVVIVVSVYKPRGLTRHGWRATHRHMGPT